MTSSSRAGRPGRLRRLAATAAATLLPIGLVLGCGESSEDPADASSSSESPEDTDSADGTDSTDGAGSSGTEEATTPEQERLAEVVAAQGEDGELVYGAIPEGLPAGVLPEGQAPELVAGSGDPSDGWVVYVQSTQSAPDALATAAEGLRQAGYVEGEPAAVAGDDEVEAPESGEPQSYGDLRVFALDSVLVGIGASPAEGDDILQSRLILVVSPS